MQSGLIRVFATGALPPMDIVEVQGRIVITPEALADARAAKQLRRAARQQRRDATVSAVGSTRSSTAHAAPTEASSALGDEAQRSPSVSSSSDEEEEDVSGEEPTRATASPPAASSSEDVVEVPLGHVEQDHLSEKRCTLCIDTLRVDGSRSTYKHPLLVLKACSAARMQRLRRAVARTHADSADPPREGGIGPSTSSFTSSPTTDVSEASTMLFSEWLQAHPDALQLNSLYLDDFIAEEKSEESESADAPDAVQATRKRQRDGDYDAHDADDGSPSTNADRASPAAPPSASSVYKDYELVGVVRGSLLFNSKPARVFQ